MPSAREDFLSFLSARIPAPAGAPVLVAIDGMAGVGKTTLRGELAASLRALGRDVAEATGDDFHHPRERRYAQGRRSAQGYFEDAYDYDALASRLLRPLRAQAAAPSGAQVAVHLRHHDLVTDDLLDDPPTLLGLDVTLLVDGSFLLKPEVEALWDVVILVEATREVSVARQASRDGTSTDPDDPYYERYLRGYELYVERCSPRARAHVIVDNTDVARPSVLRASPSEVE